MRRSVLIVLLATLGLSGCRHAETYPSRPILLICPWSAGGGTDRVSRQVAVLLEREIGVPVNVVNATGGSGVTGHTRGALAAPDGYTLTMATVELNMLHWRGLTSISYKDFDPLMQLNRDAAALFVRTDSPWKTVGDLAEDLKAKPGTIKASGTAQGGIWHIALVGWLLEQGLSANAITWLSINGAAPSLQELMSGGVEVVCCSIPEADTLREAGRVRCLGVMAPRRVESFPDIPTFAEQGIPWSMAGWRGLALPLGVEPARKQQLLEAMERVVSSDEYRKFLKSTGFEGAIALPDDFTRSLTDDEQRFEKILTSPAFRQTQTDRVGPMTFPIVLGVLILGFLAVLGWRPEPGHDSKPIAIHRAGLIRIGLTLSAIVIYLLVLDTAGFVITGMALLASLLLIFGANWWAIVGLPVLLIPLVYQVFAVIMRVPLPWGWFGW